MAFAAPDTDLEKPQGFSAPSGDLETGGFSAPKEDIANHVQNLVSDKSFDPAQYAIQTGDTETAFQARQALRNRTLGQKAGVIADTLTNPETYVNAAKGVGKFAAGLVATPLHTLAQAGATVGAPIAGALGADSLQHTLENEQQTQGAEATLAGQQIEQGIRGMGRGIRNTAQDLTGAAQDEATQRAHFAAEIEAAKNNAQLAQSRPLNTGVVSSLAQAVTGTPNLSDVYSPEALQTQGARPVSEALTGSMAAAADPTNLLIPLAGKIPGVSTVAGGLVQGAGKVASGIGMGLGYAADAQRAFHVPILTALTHGLTGGLEAQAAKLGSQLGAKAFNFIGDSLDQQGGAMRSGIPSALDQTAQQALSAGESALGTNAQRVIGNTAGNVVATALGFAPLNYALSGGDPQKFAESEVGAGAMGGVFGLAGERARMENTAQYRLAKYGAQQFSDNPQDFAAHQAAMAKFSPQDQQAINAMRGALYGGTGTDVIVLDGPSYAAKVGPIGGDTRGQFQPDGKVVYLNADAIGNQRGGTTQTLGHETGHAVVDFLRNAGREADAQGLLSSVSNGLTPEQVTDMTIDYQDKLLKSTDLTGKTPQEIDAIKQQIANDNPPEKVLEENLSEITRRILSGRGISSFALPQSTLERLTDTASRFMEARGWMPAIDPNASLGFKAQMVREAARRMSGVLYETGKRASAAAGEGDTVTQKLIKARQALADLPQVTPDMPASKAGAINRQRQAAEKEITDIQGSMGIPTHPTAPTPTAPTVAQDGASGATVETPQAPLNRNRIAAMLRQQGLSADEAKQWASVAEGANEEMAMVDALKKRAQQKFPSTPAPATPEKPNERPVSTPQANEPLPTGGGGAEPGNGGGVATVEPVSVPAKDAEGTGAGEKEASVVHTPEDLDAIAAKAKEDFLATKQLAKAGKNKGKHTADNQKLADKAAFDAAAEAHSATLPANYQGIKQRVDAFGKKTVSGQLDPSRPFDSWLIDQAKASKMLNDASLQTLLKFQDAIGKTITYDYGHAPVAEGEQPTGESRAAQQAKHSVAQRLAGEAPQQVEAKTSIPLSVGFNPGSKSFTVFGASPEKLLNNFNHIAEAMGQAGEKTPYRDINDPRLVADIKAVIRNHQNGWQGDGSRPAVGTAEYPNVANPDWANSPERTQIPPDRFEFVNMMLGDEGAKAGSLQAKAKAHLANENRRLVNEAGETNELRQKINDAIPWKDKNGQPASWSSVNLEDPLNENISPALADNIRESSQSDESIRQHGKVGDLGRFFEGGRTPNRAKTAAGFLPAEEAGAEDKSEPVKARAAKLWKEQGTDSPFFKKWFGDSAARDDDGKPKMLFTGQPRGLSEIPQSERNELPMAHSFLSDSREVAGKYSGASERSGETDFSTGRKGQTYRVYASIENPMDLDSQLDENKWKQEFIKDGDVPGKMEDILGSMPDEKISAFAEKYGVPTVDSDGDAIRQRRIISDVVEKMLAVPQSDIRSIAEREVVADALGLRRDEIEDDSGHTKHVGYLLNEGNEKPFPKDFDISDVIEEKWNAQKGQGRYLQDALDDSPTGKAMVLFPEIGERIVKSNGHDGYVHTDTENGGKTWIPFSPEQIKSATSNSGEFDSTSPNIRFMPDTGTPGEGSTPGERLAREAEAAGVVLKVDQLKGLIQQDQSTMEKIRARIEQQTGKPARFMPADEVNALLNSAEKRNRNGERKIRPEDIGLPYENFTPPSGNQNTQEEIPVSALKLGRDELNKVQLMAANRLFQAQPFRTKGVSEIHVVPSTEKGRYVVAANGNHRAAILMLTHPNARIPVTVTR